MTTTIPAARTVTPDTDRSYGEHRTHESVWLLGDLPDGFSQDSDVNAVRLTITHSRKQYRVTIKTIRLHAKGHREAFDFRDTDREEVSVEPGPRYSRKTLDRIAAEALAAFPGNIPEDTKAAALWERIVAQHAAAAA